MEIAGREIDDRVLIAGAAGLGLIFLLTRGKSESEETYAYLRPAEGLDWGDVVDPPSSRDSLIGPGGPAGFPGAPGVPGIPGTPGTPGTGTGSGSGTGTGTGSGGGGGGVRSDRGCRRDRECETGYVCLDGRCRRDRNREDTSAEAGRGRDKREDREDAECRRDGQCGSGFRCRNGKCKPEREANGVPKDRPRQEDRPTQVEDDPRIDTPKREKRREDAGNTVESSRMCVKDRDCSGGRVCRNGKCKEAEEAERDRPKKDARGETVTNGSINGVGVNVDVSGGVAKDKARGRGKDRGKANANADAGTYQGGNVGANSQVTVNASGGYSTADASGASGQVSGGGGGKNRDKGKRRGGDFGYTRTHPNPGGTIGGFFGASHPITLNGETAEVQEGESLKGLSRRVYGYEAFWPRIVELNNEYDFAGRGLVAGTVFRIG